MAKKQKTEQPVEVVEPKPIIKLDESLRRPAPPEAEPPDEREAAAAAAPEPRKPVAQDIKLTARQYVRARRFRWERCAGFLLDMKKRHPGPATRDEWSKLWDAFWSRPVK